MIGWGFACFENNQMMVGTGRRRKKGKRKKSMLKKRAGRGKEGRRGKRNEN